MESKDYYIPFDYFYKNIYASELNFGIRTIEKYEDCWLGIGDVGERNNWIGNGEGVIKNEGYSYNSREDLLNSPVFNDRSLKELWEYVEIYVIDGYGLKEYIETFEKSDLLDFFLEN